MTGGSTITEGFATTTTNLIGMDLSVQVGSITPPLAGTSTAIMDPTHAYLLTASKDRTNVRVTLIDVSAPSLVVQTLLFAPVPTNLGRLRLANVEMAVNSGPSPWNAGLIALGVYSRALGDTDLNALFVHYGDALGAYDPVKLALKNAQDAAAAAAECPYDDATCSACSGIADWSSMAGSTAAVFATGGSQCVQSIGAYCTANPSAPQCSCWDTSNPAYGGLCSFYRAAFDPAGAQAAQDAALEQALKDAIANGCQAVFNDDDDDSTTVATYGSSSHNNHNDFLSPSHIDSMAKLIGAIRGGDDRRECGSRPQKCCDAESVESDDESEAECPASRRIKLPHVSNVSVEPEVEVHREVDGGFWDWLTSPFK